MNQTITKYDIRITSRIIIEGYEVPFAVAECPYCKRTCGTHLLMDGTWLGTSYHNPLTCEHVENLYSADKFKSTVTFIFSKTNLMRGV